MYCTYSVRILSTFCTNAKEAVTSNGVECTSVGSCSRVYVCW